MVTALYRRYRPDTFADLIGQEQVVGPLTTALETNRVNHAYLFSGPRGCGKTTSARILARCLNCEQGPTATPCGECASCRELATGGQGSLDVVEIDAASHNGVDDARELRERAAFAPARDRFKIFILDEAHMVTPQGFNAMLKLVEEPPEHVKFIFATTEPEKVIGTIRSRTHHYPFRLVPPAVMLPFLQKILDAEHVVAEPGVLPLAIRAGGGSVRDTLSIVDQLMAGSEPGTISYERTVGLLGYTRSDLLDAVIDAVAGSRADDLFTRVDSVVQTGQDPRRFVEDLLDRLRDIMVVQAAPKHAQAILRGISPEEFETLRSEAAAFARDQLTRAAEVASAALNSMTGATSPRIQLELMCARLLLPEADRGPLGPLSRIDRLERRVGIEQGTPMSAAAPPATQAPAPTSTTTSSTEPSIPAARVPTPAVQPAPPEPVHHTVKQADDDTTPRSEQPPRPASPHSDSRESAAADSTTPGSAATAPSASAAPKAEDHPEPASASQPAPSTPAGHELTVDQLRNAWPQVLEDLGRRSRNAWIVLTNADVLDFKGDVLVLAFGSQNDALGFKNARDGKTNPVAAALREVLHELFGVRVKFLARVKPGVRVAPQSSPPPQPESAPGPTQRPSAASASGIPNRAQPTVGPSATPQRIAPEPEPPIAEPPDDDPWAIDAEPPVAQPQTSATTVSKAPIPQSGHTASPSPEGTPDGNNGDGNNGDGEHHRTKHHAKYGEAVIREMLHARPVDE